MSETQFAKNYLAGLTDVIGGIDPKAVEQAIEAIRDARDSDHTIFSCGNGGSASIASQMVVDLVKGGSYGKAKRIKMLGLTDSISTITAYSNDVSYDSVFVEQLKNWARPGDVLIAISGSGNSGNIIEAVEYANELGLSTIGCTTGEGGKLKDLATIPLLVPSNHMGHLEDCFFVMTHVMCYAFIEDRY